MKGLAFGSIVIQSVFAIIFAANHDFLWMGISLGIVVVCLVYLGTATKRGQ